eukprot:CAMPEP_0119106992 /NCGR_PEP_ID=MMETSP1180-20130426/7887_1 /TAXON_ID=3052 ORGANISM="Chlamydomonas cf sp, Strain CCMP681" /NCGR_SAMPLE_ID=MMETSP1180 /ASSEMBLY_ACC=CAM_ASM_000741 /LENGTH=335 /DNA_ID=CAMNT_0007092413 /DNA_START=23 /DNA_END=1030 /DNA_ORIENTATION=+
MASISATIASGPGMRSWALCPASSVLARHSCSRSLLLLSSAAVTLPQHPAPTRFSFGPNQKAKTTRCVSLRAKEHDADLDEGFVEVKVESVRLSPPLPGSGAAIVYLRVLNGQNPPQGLPVHVGEHESSALLKEINKTRSVRPITHDVCKHILQTIGYKITKIRITDIVANTYYSRIFLAKVNAKGEVEGAEVDVDARPSDAINLAVRFGAPMYVSKRIAELAMQPLEPVTPQNSALAETHADIVRSVRDMLASFEDPTIMFQLQKELAVREQRFEDARKFQAHIYHEMTHSQALRLVVAMECALADGRYEEAARLRDEYRRLAASQLSSSGEKR